MNQSEFEQVLDRTCERLTLDLRASNLYHDQQRFQQHVQDTLRHAGSDLGIEVAPTFHPHAFPDVRANGYGVEVKYTAQDTWVAVGNSIFEGMRDPAVEVVYVVYGKAGGFPSARWAKYEDCIKHVRVSHAPRFVVDLGDETTRLFDHLPVSYDEFAELSDDEKMAHIREYSRNRLADGERLWWLEPSHSVPVAVRFYQHLEMDEKRMLRAEAALLCPQVCGNQRGRYLDAAHYALMHHGVVCTQVRDLFTAGSAAGAHGEGDNPEGPYIIAALRNVEHLMRDAAERLPDALFVEYWGASCPPLDRVAHWLARADSFAADWQPSAELFQIPLG